MFIINDMTVIDIFDDNIKKIPKILLTANPAAYCIGLGRY